MECPLLYLKRLRWVSAWIVGLILSVAAIGKMLYPGEVFLRWYLFLGVVELLMAIGMVVFSHRWQAWALLSIVFASWSGYSLYSLLFGLPCHCLGAGIDLPRGTTLMMDIAVLALCWIFLRREISYRIAWMVGAAGAFVIGFFFAQALLYLR